MDDFVPIDQKDSDAEYRALVRDGIAKSLGVTLNDLSDPDILVGEWEHTIPQMPERKPTTITFRPDGTFKTPASRDDIPVPKWEVTTQTYVQTTWCPPMPEYDIEEGFWTQDAFLCAMIDRDRVVVWNGDGSVVWLFTRKSG
ncbi:hypothetical protein [Stieleria varia]|nr:hypothetical protein [Stieleria varia]